VVTCFIHKGERWLRTLGHLLASSTEDFNFEMISQKPALQHARLG